MSPRELSASNVWKVDQTSLYIFVFMYCFHRVQFWMLKKSLEQSTHTVSKPKLCDFARHLHGTNSMASLRKYFNSTRSIRMRQAIQFYLCVVVVDVNMLASPRQTGNKNENRKTVKGKNDAHAGRCGDAMHNIHVFVYKVSNQLYKCSMCYAVLCCEMWIAHLFHSASSPQFQYYTLYCLLLVIGFLRHIPIEYQCFTLLSFYDDCKIFKTYYRVVLIHCKSIYAHIFNAHR